LTESLERTSAASSAALPFWTGPVLAFAAFGGLVVWRMGASALAAGSGVVVGALFGFLVSYVLVLALSSTNPSLGRAAVTEAAETGFLLILPFAILALAAELLLGWQASQVFSSAALMTSGGAVGIEVVRRGGGQVRGVLVPSAVAFLLSAAWVALSTFAAANWQW
jgi:hypothetical protein